MRKALLFLVVVLGGFAAYNSRLAATRECGCEPEWWCKKPILRHYRWVAPLSTHNINPPDYEERK